MRDDAEEEAALRPPSAPEHLYVECAYHGDRCYACGRTLDEHEPWQLTGAAVMDAGCRCPDAA